MNKMNDLGMTAKVLLDLHLEKPGEFDAETVLEKLFQAYERLDLVPGGEGK